MAPGTNKAANPLRDKLDDDTLDLSLMQLSDVPVNYIADLPKGTTLDLSNNMLVQLPESFPMLTHLVKLDLSKNQLRELPEFFGHLRLLRHLDLYSNQLQRLPVSFAQLRNLKWLDLKHNPLVPALQQAAGPCITPADCAMCAKKVVALLQSMESQLERERQKMALEEQRAETARREAEEREREKLRAEKRAAKEKRREEARLRDTDVQRRKVQHDGDGPRTNGRHADSLDAEDDFYSRPLKDQKDGRSRKGRGCCWSLLMFLSGILLVCMASGISLLWIYTGGHLDQKSIGKALPAIRKDAGGVFVSLDGVYQDRLAPFVHTTWAELSRRHEALTAYVNKNLGPSFCAVTASTKQYWAWAQTRVHDGWTWLKPQLNSTWEAVRPHFHALGEAVIRMTTSVLEYVQKAAPVYWDWLWHKCAFAFNYVATTVDTALNG